MKVYGPYIRKKDGRKHVVIYDPTATPQRTTVSYPKYLMEQHLGRKLTDDETVDHIDEDYTNDDISNLRIITRVDNSKRSAPKMIQVDGQCALCGVTFTLSKYQMKLERQGKNCAGPFCGKVCQGKYSRSVQLGGQVLGRADITIEYEKESGGELSEKQKKQFGL